MQNPAPRERGSCFSGPGHIVYRTDFRMPDASGLISPSVGENFMQEPNRIHNRWPQIAVNRQ